jgi:hypothetical protein
MAHYETLMKRDMPKKPTAIHASFGLIFHPLEKVNAIANCLENQFTLHDLYGENHKRQVEATVRTLLEAIENNSPRE